MEIWTTILIETVLLVPFFGYGVYTIYRRLHKREETTIIHDCVTLLVIVIFVAFQVHYLDGLRSTFPVECVFSILGLLFSTAALYGHVAYSLVNHIFMDVASPNAEDENEPRWGAAEALERVGDHEGALAEYFKLTKRYPHHPGLSLRIADSLVQLNRTPQAVPYMRMALDRSDVPQRQLEIVNRLCDLYTGALNEPDHARKCLEDFIEKNPRSKQAESATRRLERLKLDWVDPPKSPLDTLDENPVEDMPDDMIGLLPRDSFTEELDALEECPLYWSGPPESLEADNAYRKAMQAVGGDSELSTLEDEPIEEDEEEDDSAPEEGDTGSSLERL